MYFGRNTKLSTTSSSPERYGSDKGVNDLSLRDKKTTREQLLGLSAVVRYEFEEFDHLDHLAGHCTPLSKASGGLRCNSLIQLNGVLCTAAYTKDITSEDLALSDFHLAAVMLHEISHAANYDVMGKRREDFFEDALVAEAGFELVSRLFGLIPAFYPKKDHHRSRAIWYNWQTKNLNKGYDLNKLCRDQQQLDKKWCRYKMDYADVQHVLKLLNDDFWKGEYLVRGGVTIVPSVVIELITKYGDFDAEDATPTSGEKSWMENEGVRNVYQAIPTSIKELWMASEGISFAQKRYPHLANKYYELRKPASDVQSGDA